jgi:CRP/FNR family transcriptional regulator, cyclic AMP receptor protein
MEISDLLRGVPQFASLSEADLEALAGAFVVQDYPDDHVFIREGHKGNTIYLVVEGTVRVTKRQGLKKRELRKMRPGDLFGLLAIVEDAPRRATCKATGPVKVGSLAHGSLLLLFNQAAPIASAFQLAVAAQLARDYRQVNQRLHRLLTAVIID